MNLEKKSKSPNLCTSRMYLLLQSFIPDRRIYKYKYKINSGKNIVSINEKL